MISTMFGLALERSKADGKSLLFGELEVELEGKDDLKFFRLSSFMILLLDFLPALKSLL